MEILGHFKQIRQRIESFADRRPNYLSKTLAIREDDYTIERDLKARFQAIPAMPYQEPFIYRWLNDVWQYHRVRVYKNEADSLNNLVLATAPTGRFNALAIHDEVKNAILIEDGLLYFSRQFCTLISKLLYRHHQGKIQFVNAGSELASQIHSNYSIIETLLETTTAYLTDDFLIHPRPHPLDQDDDDGAESAGDAMFNGLITFVIEHELHHLLARPEGKHLLSNVKESFDDLWKIFEKDVIPHVSSPIQKEEVQQLFEDHQEEIYADFRAVNLVLAQARADKKIWPTMDGAMVFYHVIELFRWVLLALTDQERLRIEAQSNGVWLSIAAILHGETHPYPLVRRAGLLEFFKRSDTPFYEILLDRETRFAQIFKAIRQILLKKMQEGTLPKRVSDKWLGNQSRV